MADQALVDAAMETARQVAAELMDGGASAVVLMGSFARGDATPQSDIDLYAIGEGPHYRLERREPFLVSVSWRTGEEIRKRFRTPSAAFGLVPGWRSAVILSDPQGIAARLQSEARKWSMEMLDQSACDRWVAEEITGFAEEIHKLVSYRESEDRLVVAVNRSILALRLAVPLAVHRRLLYETENHLWTLVNEALGKRWADAQSRAFGMAGETLDETVQATCEMFALACQDVGGLLDARQRAVVEHACRIAGFPLEQLETGDV